MLMNEVKKKNQLKKEQKKLAESTCVNLPNSSHKTNITQQIKTNYEVQYLLNLTLKDEFAKKK